MFTGKLINFFIETNDGVIESFDTVLVGCSTEFAALSYSSKGPDKDRGKAGKSFDGLSAAQTVTFKLQARNTKRLMRIFFNQANRLPRGFRPHT